MKSFFVFGVMLMGTSIMAASIEENLKLLEPSIDKYFASPMLIECLKTEVGQNLLKDMKSSSQDELIRQIYKIKESKKLDLYVIALEQLLSPEEYLALLSKISINEKINSDVKQNLFFPKYSKRGIIALNYKEPQVKEMIDNLKSMWKDNPKLLRSLQEIESGVAFKNLFSQKMEAYHDNFLSFPILNKDKNMQTLQLIGLAIYAYDVNVFMKKMKLISEKNKDQVTPEIENALELYDSCLKSKPTLSRQDALKRSDFIFSSDKSLSTNDDYRNMLESSFNGQDLLYKEILTLDSEVMREISIDMLFLTIYNDIDEKKFHELTVSNNQKVQKYALEKLNSVTK